MIRALDVALIHYNFQLHWIIPSPQHIVKRCTSTSLQYHRPLLAWSWINSKTMVLDLVRYFFWLTHVIQLKTWEPKLLIGHHFAHLVYWHFGIRFYSLNWKNVCSIWGKWQIERHAHFIYELFSILWVWKYVFNVFVEVVELFVYFLFDHFIQLTFMIIINNFKYDLKITNSF